MLKKCNELISLWNTKRINYCHWKSNEHLEAGLDGQTDLDMFVTPSDCDSAEALLSSIGFIKCVPQSSNQYPSVCEWLGFDEMTGKLIHVHLHYCILTGAKYCKEYIYPINDLIVSSRILDEQTNVYITNPNLEIILLYSRIVLKAENKSHIYLSKDVSREITYLKERIDYNTLSQFCEVLVAEKGGELYSIITKSSCNEKDWENLYHIVSKWLAPYKRMTRLSVFIRTHFYKIYNKIIRVLNNKLDKCILNKKTLPHQGLTVCFLGQDGSGKSTLTVELCDWLGWKLSSKRFYLGSGEHYNGFLKRVTRYSKTAEKQTSKLGYNKKNATDIPQRRKWSLKSIYIAVIFCTEKVAIARHAYREVKRATRFINKGGIALFDRFPQNQFEGLYDGPKIKYFATKSGLNYWFVRLLSKVESYYINKTQTHSPTIVFKLILSPEESLKRKPFENPDVVSKKHEITKALVFPKSHVYELNAEDKYNNELLLIKNIIWRSLLLNQ